MVSHHPYMGSSFHCLMRSLSSDVVHERSTSNRTRRRHVFRGRHRRGQPLVCSQEGRRAVPRQSLAQAASGLADALNRCKWRCFPVPPFATQEFPLITAYMRPMMFPGDVLSRHLINQCDLRSWKVDPSPNSRRKEAHAR